MIFVIVGNLFVAIIQKFKYKSFSDISYTLHMQIFCNNFFTDVSYENETSNYVVLWTADGDNNTFDSITELYFDPASEFHTYTLAINMDTDDSGESSWEMVLLIDDVERAMLGGASKVSTDTQVMLSVYNRYGQVADIEDFGATPQVSAMFRNIRLGTTPVLITQRNSLG